MTAETISYRFVVRRGPAASWTATNNVLLAGEWGLETDTKRMKMGDGATAWGALPYLDPSLHLSLLGDVDKSSLADGMSLVWSATLGKHVYKKASGNYQAGLGIAIDAVTNPDAPVISSTVAGIALKGRVATFAALPSSGNGAGDAYVVDADGLIYVWNGIAWPSNGSGMHSGGGGMPVVQLLPPKASIFTAFGTGATLTDKAGRLQMLAASSVSGIKGGVVNLPAPPYTVDFGAAAVAFPGSGVAVAPGICISDGTKFVTFYPVFTGSPTASGMSMQRDNYTNAGVFANTPIVRPWAFNPASYFIRVTDDGTTRNWYASQNGLDFNLFYTEATNTFLTATKCGIVCYNNSSGTLPAKMSIYHWKVTGSVLGDGP